MTQSPKLTAHQLRKSAEFLRELAFFFGTGEANPVRFAAWHARFRPDADKETARREWERAKEVLSAVGAPIRRLRDGREVHLLLDREACEYAEQTLAGLDKYRLRLKGAPRIGDSRFLLVDVEDIAEPEDWEADPAALEVMQRSIRECPLGVIHPVILVGVAAPFHVGVGRLRFAACKALGLEQIPVRLVEEWDELIALDENLVRQHYAPAEVQRLRELRDRLIAAKTAEGKSTRQVAAELGISRETVRRRSGDTGVSPEHAERVTGRDAKAYPAGQPETGTIERRREIARALREEGLTTRQIAKELGVSTGTAHADLKAGESGDTRHSLDVTQFAGVISAWRGLDAATADPWLCLTALEEGLAEVLTKAEGTPVYDLATEFERLFDRVIARVRKGDFEQAPPWQAA